MNLTTAIFDAKKIKSTKKPDEFSLRPASLFIDLLFRLFGHCIEEKKVMIKHI